MRFWANWYRKLSLAWAMSERARDYSMVIPGVAIYVGLWPLVGEGKAFASAVVFGVFYVFISKYWDRRADKRFWVIVGVFALLHVVGLSLTKIPHLSAGLIALPFGLVDVFTMSAILDWVEAHFPGQKA